MRNKAASISPGKRPISAATFRWTAISVRLEKPSQTRRQAGLVEHRRVEQIGHGADLALTLLDQCAALLERCPGHRFQLRAQAQGLSDAEGRAEQVLRGSIMQFAPAG